MLVPSIFENSFVDDLFDDVFSFPTFSKKQMQPIMKTDVKDLGDSYQLDIEMPGFDKENIHAELNQGYLTVSAKKEENKDEKDDNGKFIRKERYSGECKRSFYVGNHLKEEDIKAGFENGILKLTFPKEDKKVIPEQKKYIAIE